MFEFYTGLKSLDSLGLAHNRIRTVPARAFFHLAQLNSLELDGNEIIHVDPDAFIGLEGEYNRIAWKVNLLFRFDRF